jgi:four helix bundle protein
MSHKNLEVWKLARDIAHDIHEMSISQLPWYEQNETGHKIRNSAKEIKSKIVLGYGFRKDPEEFIDNLRYAITYNEVTKDYLETLYETESLSNKHVYDYLRTRMNVLKAKLHGFIEALKNQKSN